MKKKIIRIIILNYDIRPLCYPLAELYSKSHLQTCKQANFISTFYLTCTVKIVESSIFKRILGTISCLTLKYVNGFDH